MNKPTVCIMLSTYNGAPYIDEQIESLLSQHDVDFRIHIRDDGSSDGTVQKLIEYGNVYPDQIQVNVGKNLGVIGSFFELMRQTKPVYDFYAFCDQDDVWKPDKLIRAAKKLKLRQSNIPLMYCSSTQMVDQDLNNLNVWPTLPSKPLSMYNAVVENRCVGCTMILNQITFERVRGNIPADLTKVIMHDWWIYLFVSAFGEVIFDEEPTILYRQHQGNVLGGSNESWIMKWKNRWVRFMKGNNHFILSKQAQLFMHLYKDQLSAQQQKDLQQFLYQLNASWINRIIYAIKMPFYRQSTLDNAVLKLIYVLKKV
ncbi:glycosyltransferase family 2 protein [Paenibacillus sp. Root52]|uniref:Glycosyltransferase involved in cell wall biosynthesis n=2 Tax=Paenibacillus amylolyticus TaxID=1451 RepID=A0AAP5LRE0_PAEAM|nr:glycosyltransferase family 2 protein [Paenibacillus sp. Root52]MDR6726605.1 glycosyltransferase involved in cell wall biosynthesis [Paenibacillus amylolyticus]